ncbi:MAG: hypothetical protein GYA46_07970 [candidate division Zixibacteria bacterium]|nr:hypothetical protein [candidate division Zixibacteria bacterium]
MRRFAFYFIGCILTTASLFAGSQTPYKHSFGGNGYTSEMRYTYPWLVRHFDAAMAGSNDFLKALLDTARVYGENFDTGPYASSQEINLYEKTGASVSYATRMADTLKNWLYIYAKHYLDSIGVSVESLVVHIADTAVSITQQGDGTRSYSLTGLPMHKKRFTYQYWNNTSSDYFYPAGYVWLANGYNEDARNAIAYAYRRRLIEDSAKVGAGPIRSHYTAYFMDNQYRDMGRLGSYYTINSTSGGRTTQMDWVEQTAIQNDSQVYYFDHSTLRIDSTIQAVLDSTCAARGLRRIRGYANINKFSPAHLSAVLPYVAGVSLENPIDYAKSPQNWRSWYEMADTMAAHPEVSVNWGLAGDILCSSSPSSWLYDSTRIYMMHYAFFLTVQDTNAYVDMMRFNDSLRWRDIYEVDFGRPDGPAYEVSHTGTSDWGATPYIYVMRRDYNGGSAAVLVRTAHDGADFTRDSVAVNLHGLFREMLANGQTGARVDSIVYLKPYMGKIMVAAANRGPQVTFTSPVNRFPIYGQTDTIAYTATADSGLTRLRIQLRRPSGVIQTLVDAAFNPPVKTYTGRQIVTWTSADCGLDSISVYARDNTGAISDLPAALTLAVSFRRFSISAGIEIINYVFRGGPVPDDYPGGDANCDGSVNIQDAIHIVTYLFRGGPPPCCDGIG